MLRRILIVALCLNWIACKSLVEKYKRSSSGVSELEKKVLYDARTPSIRANGAPALPGPAECKAPLTTVQGSFTYAAEQEQATLYRCDGTNKLIVYSGGKVQASSDTAYSDIAAVFDLNQDDKNEMLLIGETNRNGELSREASLDTFEKNSLRAVENFGIVYHDGCALFAGADETRKSALIAQGRSPYIEGVVVYYLPRPGHELPNFTAQRFRAPCPDSPNGTLTWQPVSPK